MDLGLSDRVYLLTGASRGLGYATAQALVAAGARVLISARDARQVAAAAGALTEAATSPAGVHGLAADITDPGTPQRLIDAATDKFGRLDGALISVGGPPRMTAAAASDDDWRASFETVFLGSVRMLRSLVAVLPEGGAVALVLSTSVRAPLTGLGISNGLRPGLAGVVKEIADEYGPRGVRVLSLLPGSFLTERNSALLGSEQARAAVSAAIPLRRLGQPEEFGRVAAFLLSPAASYVTGVAIPIDGGLLRSY